MPDHKILQYSFIEKLVKYRAFGDLPELVYIEASYDKKFIQNKDNYELSTRSWSNYASS